jgi:DNA-binding NtrC family response regulator
MFFDLVQNPNMASQMPVFQPDGNSYKELSPTVNGNNFSNNPPQVIFSNNNNNPIIQHHEEFEESLSIIDKEKELIVKALKKHRGKRKDASLDLGISERTLYRKLKEYDIENL